MNFFEARSLRISFGLHAPDSRLQSMRPPLAPFSDSPESLQGVFFRVGELVKCGLSRETALRALTLVPAEILGIEKRVGSLEVGKDADLLLFSGDPLSSQSRLREVYINGKQVFQGD